MLGGMGIGLMALMLLLSAATIVLSAALALIEVARGAQTDQLPTAAWVCFGLAQASPMLSGLGPFGWVIVFGALPISSPVPCAILPVCEVLATGLLVAGWTKRMQRRKARGRKDASIDPRNERFDGR
jgi:hypothetical protein